MAALTLEPEKTGAPYSTVRVEDKGLELAALARPQGATGVWVRVDIAQIVNLPCDQHRREPSAPPPPPSASELAVEVLDGAYPRRVRTCAEVTAALKG